MSPTSSPTHREREEAVSAEDNKALVRRFVDEVQSGGNTDLIDEICSAEFVNHSASPGLPADREGIKSVTPMFRRAFPDSYFPVEDMIAEADKVRVSEPTSSGWSIAYCMATPPNDHPTKWTLRSPAYPKAFIRSYRSSERSLIPRAASTGLGSDLPKPRRSGANPR